MTKFTKIVNDINPIDFICANNSTVIWVCFLPNALYNSDNQYK